MPRLVRKRPCRQLSSLALDDRDDGALRDNEKSAAMHNPLPHLKPAPTKFPATDHLNQ